VLFTSNNIPEFGQEEKPNYSIDNSRHPPAGTDTDINGVSGVPAGLDILEGERK